MKKLFIILGAVAGMWIATSAAVAQHDHNHAAPVLPTSYFACVARATALGQGIEKALAAGNQDGASDDGYEMMVLAKTLGKAALGEASVPREKVKAINALGKEIADAAEGVHEAAEGKKMDEAKAKFAVLKPLLAKLEGLIAEKYVCAMHCEDTKTYDAAGTCPVCKMALTRLSQTPYYAQVTAPGSPEAGKPTRLDIRLLDPAGNPVTGVETVHEHPLHFMIVSEDLSFYAHLHPDRQADGSFRLNDFKFPFGGRFMAYSDFTPTGAANQVSKYEFKVPDGSIAHHESVKLVEDYDGVGKDGDYEFRVRCNGKEFFAGQDSFLRYGIDLKGQPVKDLQPLMGAMGHLVIISKDLESYIHAHPLDFSGKHDDHAGHEHHADAAIIEKGRAFLLGNGNPSDVVFHAVLPAPGIYRAFAQFQHKGKVLTYAVTIDAKPGTDGAAPAADPAGHQHDHAAPAKPGAAGGK